MSGMPRAKQIDLAYVMPTSSDPTNPGPCVTAMAERSSQELPDRSIADRTTGTIALKCSREASSGTTPPYLEWVSSWEATTELSIVARFESSWTTAAAVSSQDDSIPSILTFLL